MTNLPNEAENGGGQTEPGQAGHPPAVMTGKPTVLIPVAPGTNRNEEMAMAFRAAGAETNQVPLAVLRSGEVKMMDHQILAIPGGFSYGDALGAGRLLGLDLAGWFSDQMMEARDRNMPIIGICNGFQALVKAGLLPGDVGATTASGRPVEITATLTENRNSRFECRWVELLPEASWSPWMADLTEPIRCPVAHGEGRFVASDLSALEHAGRVAFRYGDGTGVSAGLAYPSNPNGSAGDIAGVVDQSGLVLGLMPHPEDHVLERQDPHRRRQLGGRCLPLFEAGVRAALQG